MMKKTVKNTSNKSLQALALNNAQLTQVKGGTSNFIVDDDVNGLKPVAPTGKDFVIDDDISGF
jgi:hypothetical protein